MVFADPTPRRSARVSSAALLALVLSAAVWAADLPLAAPDPQSRRVPDEWTQDAHDAQRTGYTAEEPEEPWRLAWTFNGPDDRGGTDNHFYDQPAPHTPWEARTVTGGCCVYAPAAAEGLFALRKSDGHVVWQLEATAFNAAPAYDPATGALYAGGEDGRLYKIDAASGTVLGTFAARVPIQKAVLLANGSIFVVTVEGALHRIDPDDPTRAVWSYAAGSPAQTTMAYSARRDVVVYVTADLVVHAVRAKDGAAAWTRKPSVLEPGPGREFTGGWPVVADAAGVVFVRMLVGGIDDVIAGGGGPQGRWPETNAAIRQRLIDHPQYRNLFALDLETGDDRFVPAVAPSGVEDLRDGNPILRIHSFPVIRTLPGGKQVAYTPWQNGQVADPNWDGRWDSHLGEMVLDDSTVEGYAAGGVRFVEFQQHGYMLRITDESCPLTMAGETVFHAHWAASEAARIVDRSDGKGASQSNPIATRKRPVVVRSQRCTCPRAFDARTHYTTSCALIYEHGEATECGGRWYGTPGFYVYWGVQEPPTPPRGAYSEGILPRYTYVSDGLVVVEGNGGDLFVLEHSGRSLAHVVRPALHGLWSLVVGLWQNGP